jgi:predicted Rossmann fold nucleotide-binding protein DprA/Smf involved in DNA uptake
MKPLNIREYDEVATWLIRKNWWPVDLLNEENQAALGEAFAPVEPERMKALLGRGASMAISIEKWINKGLWVLCRSDEDYPQRLKQHLKRVAPPILYGSGDRALLSKGGLAVVGSRHINGEAESFARAVGRSAAQSGMQLISGAARGVDETAMHGAFEEGGSVVGVMADSLLRAAVSGKYREGIRSGQLVLVSPYNPEAGFNVGNAMGRNKYIYALADFAVVVNSDYQEGGTWAGAEEELKRDVARPVFVRVGQDVPRGNTELLKLGGRPLPGDALRLNLREFMEKSVAGVAIPTPKDQEPVAEPSPVVAGGDRETTTYSQESSETASRKMSVRETPYSEPASILEAVKPLILKALDKPRKVDDLAKSLKVRKPQMQDWIKSLIKDGILEERVIRKSKKVSIRKPDEELKFS